MMQLKDKLKMALLIGLQIIFVCTASAQKTDMIVLKKKNNRTLKTYYPGSLILAETYDGFKISGQIKQIRNDSIVLQQRETRLKPTEFGFKLDTLYYTLSINHRIIEKFYFQNSFSAVQSHEFTKSILPKTMSRAGIAFIILELVNSIGRHERLNEKNKLVTFGVSGTIAGTGMLWSYLHRKRNRVGGKYEAIYVKAGTLAKDEFKQN
jgi:hypothetical protein